MSYSQEEIRERFVRYCKVDTQSDEHSRTTPSTSSQLALAKMLVSELTEMGIEDATLDEKGYVMAFIPSNIRSTVPAIGFIAHMDTSPDFSGKNVRPRIVENYDGGIIELNSSGNIKLSPSDFPELLKYKGQTLITTDGTTLLGADDKAGIAEIMTAAQALVSNPDIRHGKICLAFTPDEEIGRGADHFDVDKFGADFAYTLDGGEIGELEFENFNAALAIVECEGISVHPGTAKGKMINAQNLAVDFHSKLPSRERPENTEGYQGFYHLIDMEGSIEYARLRYLIRDHDRHIFEKRKQRLQEIGEELNTTLPKKMIKLSITDQYYNMREKVEPHIHIVELAEKSMKAAGIQPLVKPIRGGTDGSKLSYMGLPTPNIFTGGHNYHGKYEFIPLESMAKAVEVILNIIKFSVKP